MKKKRGGERESMPCIKAKNNDILISYFSFDLNIQTKKLKKKHNIKHT